jgi:uncharacterized protein (TIGR02145 family)
MAYKCGLSNSRSLDCCSSLFTDTTTLLPFQVISTGPFEKIEISPYGEDSWTELTLTIHEELIEGLWFISYHGDALAAPLTCGTYDIQLTAGDVWMFEPITIKDFEITTNTFTIKDDLFLPFEFLEQQVNNTPIIAPVDSFLPFMYATSNPSTAPEYYIVDEDGIETLLTITVGVMAISGKTYYIHESECIYPFLECGIYYLKIIDGLFTYYSVLFHAESNINDIPDGYRPDLDSNNKIILTDNCEISIIRCSNIIEYGYLYNYYAVTDLRNIAPLGWHVPSENEWDVFWDYNNKQLGGYLKITGYDYWEYPNTGAINLYEFNGKGSGRRTEFGVYELIKQWSFYWVSPWNSGNNYYLMYDRADVTANGEDDPRCGFSIRLLKDDDINTGEMIGNDGVVYSTCKIGNQVWLAENLKETKYRNGDIIQEVSDASIWAALTTGALCAYDNDDNNV